MNNVRGSLPGAAAPRTLARWPSVHVGGRMLQRRAASSLPCAERSSGPSVSVLNVPGGYLCAKNSQNLTTVSSRGALPPDPVVDYHCPAHLGAACFQFSSEQGTC